MTVHLQIADQFKNLFKESQIIRSAIITLKLEGVSVESDITILVDDDQRIQTLNREYLAIDSPTDVLAFPAGFTDPDTGQENLGDVIISYPQAKRNAEKRGHPVESEIQLLVVHGILHLLGYDHLDQGDKEKMWSAQSQVLSQLHSSVTMPE